MANEKRLIDANEAYEAVTDLSGQADTKSAYAAFWKAGKVIRNLPTVDAVPVVRCKDCQSFEEQHSWVNGYTGKIECCGYCYHWDYEPGSSPNQVDGDGYCSYGERENNG